MCGIIIIHERKIEVEAQNSASLDQKRKVLMKGGSLINEPEIPNKMGIRQLQLQDWDW